MLIDTSFAMPGHYKDYDKKNGAKKSTSKKGKGKKK